MYRSPYKNTVIDVPPQFKQWVGDNAERIKRAEARGTLPYFVRDNREIVRKVERYNVSDKKERYAIKEIANTNIPIVTELNTNNRTFGGVYKSSDPALHKREKELRKLNHEAMFVFKKNGTVVSKESGGAHEVTFSRDVNFKDCILTHNHPTSIRGRFGVITGSFSPDDLRTAIACDLAEMRIVSKHYTFSIRRPTDGWGNSAKIVKAYNDGLSEIDKFFFIRNINAPKSEINKYYSNKVIQSHIILKKLSKQFGFEYLKLRTSNLVLPQLLLGGMLDSVQISSFLFVKSLYSDDVYSH